jgi:hypothetical protein
MDTTQNTIFVIAAALLCTAAVYYFYEARRLKNARKMYEYRTAAAPTSFEDALPENASAVVFVGDGKSVFVNKGAPMDYNTDVLRSLWEDHNKDLVEQLNDRFKKRMH